MSTFDRKWIDILEIPLSDVEATKPRKIDYVRYYLPLETTLAQRDLGLDSNWKISALVYDYNLHKKNFKEKEWQFIVKNEQTKVSNTILAKEAEAKLFARCKITPPLVAYLLNNISR